MTWAPKLRRKPMVLFCTSKKRCMFTRPKRPKNFNPSHSKRLRDASADGFGHADVLSHLRARQPA